MIFVHVMQVFLAPTPAKAWFLKPAERRWLQKRQDDTHNEAMKRTHGANSSMIDGLINWRLWYLGAKTRYLFECHIWQVRTVIPGGCGVWVRALVLCCDGTFWLFEYDDRLSLDMVLSPLCSAILQNRGLYFLRAKLFLRSPGNVSQALCGSWWSAASTACCSGHPC